MKMLLSFITAVCLLLAQPVLAGFPSWYPKEGFQHYGEIDEVNSEHKSIIIDDYQYYYTAKTIVHSLSETSDSLARLRKDATVGYIYDANAQGQKQITEVWLLPDNYTQPENITQPDD